LRQSGLLTVAAGKITEARAHVIPEGGIGMLYLTVPEKLKEDGEKVLELFRKREGIAAVLGPTDFGKYGLPRPRESPQMADLILVAEDGYGFSAVATGTDWVTKSETTVGTHGFLSTNPKMNATFIANGAGIRKGETIDPIENIDVPATIARLLEVPFPSADGKAIADTDEGLSEFGGLSRGFRTINL
jgi:hypothetical protein